MYLRGLRGMKQIATADPNFCQLQLKGSWSGSYSVNGQPNMGICSYYEPDPVMQSQPSAPANITITVPTTTNVSPQISPQFIQQQQPTNSPIGAALTGPSSGAGDEYLKQAQAEETARQDAILKALREMSASSQQQVIVPNTTQSADSARSVHETSFFEEIPVLPWLAVLALAGVGIFAATHHTRKRK